MPRTKGSASTKTSVNDWLEGDNLIMLQGWCRRGLSNEEIANNIGIHKSTFYRWCDENKDFCDYIKKYKECSNYMVENALFEQALCGNTTAQIFWLKNRDSDRWKDRVETIDKTQVTQVVEARNLIFSVKKKTQEADNESTGNN